MDFRETDSDDDNWIELAWYRFCYWAFVVYQSSYNRCLTLKHCLSGIDLFGV
jgi:hypothetical protein